MKKSFSSYHSSNGVRISSSRAKCFFSIKLVESYSFLVHKNVIMKRPKCFVVVYVNRKSWFHFQIYVFMQNDLLVAVNKS